MRTKSSIHWPDILAEGEVNGRWVVEVKANPRGFYPAGTLVADPAPVGTDESETFTALNGKRYWDTPANSQWTPRNTH
jgi:hypothetical protein